MTATSRREHYRQIANRHRAIPGRHGLRPWRVFASVGAWSGSATGDGTRTDAETELLENGEPPKVRQVKAEQVALGVDLQTGDLVIGPITPVVGTAWATMLDGGATMGDSFRFRLVNEEQGAVLHCAVVAIQNDRALRATITVRPVRADA